jgi:hypothetical protein
MPTAMTFDTLTNDVTGALERGGSSIGDPTVFNQVPRFINAAERKIMQLLKLQGSIEVMRDPTGLQFSNPILTKPDRWRQTISLKIATGTDGNSIKLLYARGLEYCQTYWPDSTQVDPNFPPEFYADYDYTHYLIVPTPPQAYPVELVAYLQPPLLDATNQTNFFTDYTPNMLLYSTLLEATPWLRDDPRIQTWENYVQIELASLGNQDLQKVLDRASERTRP